MKNWNDDTQCASARDVMPLMKSCLLPCQQDRCCCGPLIQYFLLEQTANNLAVLNKKWHTGTAPCDSLPESNAVQTVLRANHFMIVKRQSQIACFRFWNRQQCSLAEMYSAANTLAFVLLHRICSAMIVTKRLKKKSFYKRSPDSEDSVTTPSPSFLYLNCRRAY